jgi:hypothetical protein
MPYKLIAPGIKLWVGKMTPAQELESITRASGLRMFPSANYRSKAVETIANIAPVDDPELKVDSPTKSDKPKP